MITSHKHIVVNGDHTTTTEHYAQVTGRTRAGKNGKNIMCPVCGHVHRVHHFSWTALTCTKCKSDVQKSEWLVDQLDTWRTPR